MSWRFIFPPLPSLALMLKVASQCVLTSLVVSERRLPYSVAIAGADRGCGGDEEGREVLRDVEECCESGGREVCGAGAGGG